MNFIERLKKLMKDEAITKYRLAKDLQYPISTVRSWFEGSTPRKNKLEKLAKYFHVHPGWLLYGSKEYAPTLKDKAMRVAEKLQKYGPETIKKIDQMIDIIGEDEFRKNTSIQKSKKGRSKTA